MISSTSAALRVIFLLAFTFKSAQGGYRCYTKGVKEKRRCCFRPNGKDLKLAAIEYHEKHSRFNSSAAKKYGRDMAHWCVDYVKDFSYTFESLQNFNFPLTYWNTSSAVNMDHMFGAAYAFNQPVNFDTRKVTSMISMFAATLAFNHPVTFDTAKVGNMFGMFNLASAFNQPLNLNTSKVVDMSYMFTYANAFNQPLNFDTTNVADMYNMFEGATAFNQPVKFNTAKVAHMSYMFHNAKAFNQSLPFATSNVVSMIGMFKSATSFNQDVSNFYVGGIVRDLSLMFYGASSFSSQYLNIPWSGTINGKSNVTAMFVGTACPNQTDPNLGATPQGPFCYTYLG
jgi:hypothetical protein